MKKKKKSKKQNADCVSGLDLCFFFYLLSIQKNLRVKSKNRDLATNGEKGNPILKVKDLKHLKKKKKKKSSIPISLSTIKNRQSVGSTQPNEINRLFIITIKCSKFMVYTVWDTHFHSLSLSLYLLSALRPSFCPSLNT